MKVKKEYDFRKRHLVFIDIETTGLDFDKHEIVEVACLIVNGETFEIVEEYSAKVKPSHIESADPDALKINGYNKERWKDAKDPREVLLKIAQMAEEGMIAGWNVAFDWRFIEENFKKFGIESSFNYHKVDVQSIAYEKLYRRKKAKSLRLHTVAELYGIKLEGFHNAYEDIKTTFEIFRKFMKIK